MKILEIKRIDNLEEAKNAWSKLSPNETIRDNWDFRYCFYKYFNYPLYFYAGFDGDEIVGLLPLQYNEEKKYLEFFGGNFMDNNRVFIKSDYEECIPQFYSAISQNAILKNIAGYDPFTKSLEIDKYKYTADLSDIKNMNDYFIKNFNSRSRKKLLKSIREIEVLKSEIIEDNFNDFDLLIELNKKAFGEKSLFYKPYKIESYKDLLKLNFDIHMLTFIINNQKEAIFFYIIYKDTFVGINSGTNRNSAFNLGTYLNYIKFCKAIQLKAKFYDAGLNDLGWKEKWHLEKIPQRIFTKE